jgi:hypothetical protein
MTDAREPTSAADRIIAEAAARAIVEYWRAKGFDRVAASVERRDECWVVRSNLGPSGHPPGAPLEPR